MELNPLVKWAGGKRQIKDEILKLKPNIFNNYYEPFIGGGAILLVLQPACAYINDVNEDLLAIYKCLKSEEDFKKLISKLDEHQKLHNEEYYYQVRSEDRKEDFKQQDISFRAARAIYLNKAGFNGLFRVNKQGYYNVPSGKKEKVNLYDLDNLKNVHNYFLNNDIHISNTDFSEVVKNAKKGDFVYFDPPYDVIEEKNSFTAYSKFDFTKDDQIRLASTFKELTSKGVYCMLSNHNTEFIRNLYKDFNIHVIKARRNINSKGDSRGPIEEVLITNY